MRRGAHRVQNRGRTVHWMKFIKTNKFKSDSNFEVKMPFAANDSIISKKEIWHTNNTNSVLNVFWFKVTNKTTVQLYVLCNSKRGQNYCLQIHNFTFCGRTCVSCVRPWAPLVMRAQWGGGGRSRISISVNFNNCMPQSLSAGNSREKL